MFCVSHKLALERERTWLLTNLCGKEKQADFFGKEAFFWNVLEVTLKFQPECKN